MTEHKGLPILSCADQGAREAWLAVQGATSAGIWLKLAKKDAATPSVGKAEAIESALIHGWVDGQLDRFDAEFWLTRFTPRGPRSKWSENNRATAEALLAAGRMQPAGLAEIEKAKADGRWAAAYAPQSRAEIPPDLQAALDAEPAAKAFFATLEGANRYAVLYRIQDAKRPETRAARIANFVEMLKRGEVLHPRKT